MSPLRRTCFRFEPIGGLAKVMQGRFTERHIVAAALALSLACVTYFYLLDRVAFSSAHFSPVFRMLLTRYDQRSAWLALAICVLAACWNRPAPIFLLVDFLARHPVAVALMTSALLAAGTIFIYHDHPLAMDEYAVVFQSKIFAAGSLAAHVPPALVDWLIVRGFNGSFLIASHESGQVIAGYWPGFALLLTPFQWLHAPWLCNALLSGLAVFLIHWITAEITASQRAAGWAVLFALSSGAFLAQGISYYSMQAHLTVNLAFIALLLRPSAPRAFCAGLFGSLALILHNPVPHVLFALPWIIAMAGDPHRRRQLLPLAAGYLPGAALGIVWLLFRTELGSSGAGIAAMRGVASGAFVWPNLETLNNRTAALVKMVVWAMPGLFALAFAGGLSRRSDARMRLLAYSAIMTFAGYVFVSFDQGHGWGYRYFHSAWGVIPILAGCAMAGKFAINARLVSFAGAAAALSVLLLIPLQMGQIEQFMSQQLAQLPPRNTVGGNVYFVHPLGGFYLADLIQFDPQMTNRDLFLVSHGRDLDAQLMRLNWPGAIKVSDGPAATQWFVGSVQRPWAIAQVPP